MTNYRILEKGEEVEPGDEYLLTNGEWETVRSLVGVTVGSNDLEQCAFRRKVLTHHEILKDAFDKCGIHFFKSVNEDNFKSIMLSHRGVDVEHVNDFTFNSDGSFNCFDITEV